VPLAVIATIGTTSSTAIDPLEEISGICQRENIWLHVDAAFAGSAAILPEVRWILKGIEGADSYVFNPHKWLFTNFDCSAYFIRDREALLRTFEILPEYLKTREVSPVNNYKDWGIALGRRFRALKLWFVIRHLGVAGIQEKLRLHLSLAKTFSVWIDTHPDFERLAPVPLNTVCFRYHPAVVDSPEALNRLNAALLKALNDSGKVFLTHTKLSGNYALRMVIGQTNVAQEHVEAAWKRILKTVENLAE
jgi:aromatic-L-amino-acid decarboxylase